MRGFLFAALLLASSAGCKDRGKQGEQPSERPAAPPVEAGSTGARAANELEPLWRVRVPDEPGMPVLPQGGVGPMLAGDAVVVGSSAIGFAALGREDGRVLWQRRGEERPGLLEFDGHDLWLAGRCAHLAGEAPARAVGCVERVDAADGHLVERLWIALPKSEQPDVSAEVIGMAGGGEFLWANGADLWRVRADGAATVVARGKAPVLATTVSERSLLVVSAEEIALSRPRGNASTANAPTASCAVAWRHRFAEPVAAGLAGPVAAGPVLAWVRDQVLEARQSEDGREGWTAEGRYAYAAGALRAAGDELVAIALDGGISPVRVDAATGRRAARGGVFPAIQVLSAAFVRGEGGGHPLAVAVRLEATLRRDAIALFDQGGALVGAWSLPEPSRPRSDPPRVAADTEAVFAFYDGRVVARLPAPR